MRAPSTAATQRGLTLVELMIALALGVLLTLAALQLFSTNQRGFQLQQALSTLQEDGQMAIRYITADIRNAGLDSEDNGTRRPVTVSTEAPLSIDGGDAGNDELVIAYWGTTDCRGTPVAAPDIIRNRYFVNPEGVLSCEGSLNAGNPVELLPNVESFQVQYGVDLNKNSILEVNRYLNADQLNDESVITTIRFSLLLSSTDNLPVKANTQDFYILNTQITSPSDSRIRRVFTTTVQIRNYDWDEI